MLDSLRFLFLCCCCSDLSVDQNFQCVIKETNLLLGYLLLGYLSVSGFGAVAALEVFEGGMDVSVFSQPV